MTTRPRIILVKRRTPLPLEVGTDAVTLGLIECLTRRFHVTLLAVDEGQRARRGAEALRARGIDVELAPENPMRIRRHPILGKLVLNGARVLAGQPREAQLTACDALGDLVERETRAHPDALTQFEYWTTARYRSRAGRHAALLNHDVWFRTLEELAGVAPTLRRRFAWRLEARTTRRVEIEAQHRFAHRLFLSEADRSRMAAASGRTEGTAVLPLSFPYPPVTDVSAHDRRDPVVLHVGAMNAPFNVDAVCLFARDVWPAVRRERPRARFVVAGRDPAPEVLALDGSDGIEVWGQVPELDDALRGADVFVVPARIGTGVKVKVALAMAAGLPVVGTDTGLAGYDRSEGLIRAERGEPLAAAILALLDDGASRRRAGQANLTSYRERLWSDAAHRRVIPFYEALRAG